MGRRVLLVVILLSMGAVIFWQNRHSHPAAKPIVADAPAPQFAVTDLNGKPIDSQSFHGKVVLVDFWATWCVPCEAEIPHLVDWQNKYANEGLQVVGLSMDDTSNPVKAYVAKHNMQYPVAMADEKSIAAFGGVLGLPANIVITRDGKILAKHVGVTDINVLQTEVEQALAAK